MGRPRRQLSQDHRVADLARRQDGVVTTVQLRRLGWGDADVRRLLRCGDLLRLRRGAHLVSPDRDTGRDFRVQARSVWLTVPGAVLAGTSAARLWGIDGVPDGVVEVALPPARALKARPDLQTHAWVLAPGDVEELHGMTVTSPVRTLSDLVPSLPRPQALAVLDSALRRGLVDGDDLLRSRSRVLGRRGSRLVADLWSLADGRAESVLESRVRLRCIDGGLPPDELQLEVRDGDGAVLARADLAYRTRRRPGRGPLLVEADGASVHSSPAAVHIDRVRTNGLTAQGCDVLRFTWRDTVDALTIPRSVRTAL